MAKKYNEVPVKNNMHVEKDNNDEEVVERQEKKELKKLVDKAPKKRKRGLMGRLVSGVLGPEGASGIGQYVSEEIIIPAVRNIIYSAIESTARMAIFGDKGGPAGGSRHIVSSRQATNYRPNTNYNKSYNQQPDPRERPVARSSRHSVEEYIIEDRYDASNVLISLKEYADRYDVVSVADYYELIGIPSTQYTDNNYGWTIDSIVNATIVPVRGGYVIKFPPLDVL